MSTLMEQTTEKETKQLHNNHNDEEIEIDLMDLLRKVIGIRKKVYKDVYKRQKLRWLPRNGIWNGNVMIAS